MKRLLLLGLLVVSCDIHAEGDANSRAALRVPGAQPHLSAARNDGAVLSWLQPIEGGVALQYRVWSAGDWSPAATVASGADWFINWADFPSVTPISDTLWAAHWLQKTPGGPYAYDVKIRLSQDAGQTWQPPFTLHDDGTASEHGFVTLFPWQDQMGALWLDGRLTQGAHHHATEGGPMTLRVARRARDGSRINEQELDGRVCDCCGTDIAVTETGLLAAYRDRTNNEIRDIALARFSGGSWISGIPVAEDRWRIDGCPVNGPAIDAEGNHAVVAWFTAAAERPRVRIAFSSDSGATFGDPIDVDAAQPAGRVDIELLADGDAIVSWLARSGDAGSQVVAQRVSPAGQRSNRHTIADTGAGRSSGFPQMLKVGDQLIFAWTSTSGPQHHVIAESIPLSVFTISESLTTTD